MNTVLKLIASQLVVFYCVLGSSISAQETGPMMGQAAVASGVVATLQVYGLWPSRGEIQNIGFMITVTQFLVRCSSQSCVARL